MAVTCLKGIDENYRNVFVALRGFCIIGACLLWVSYHWDVDIVAAEKYSDSLMFAFCVFQHALLLPVLVHHVRYHMCLQTLDEKMGYVFKDRSLLQVNYQLQNIVVFVWCTVKNGMVCVFISLCDCLFVNSLPWHTLLITSTLAWTQTTPETLCRTVEWSNQGTETEKYGICTRARKVCLSTMR